MKLVFWTLPPLLVYLIMSMLYFSLFIKIWKKTLHAAALENLKVCLSPVPRFSPFFLFWILGLYIWTHCLYLLGVLFKVKTFVFKFWDSCESYREFEFRYYLVLICVTLCFGSALFLVISVGFLFESCSSSFQCLCLGPAVFSCQLCVSYSLIFSFICPAG